MPKTDWMNIFGIAVVCAGVAFVIFTLYRVWSGE